ncbi:response regulator [Candidatus Omnitrophota bacterium]
MILLQVMLNLSTRKILVVDDEQDALEFLGNILRRANFEVATASQGKEAIELAQRLKPGLILLDFILTDIDGSEVCRRLKEDAETKSIPVIMMTGFGTESAQDKFRQCGADDFINKPFQTADLLAKIKAVLRSGDLSLARKKKILLVDDDQGFLRTVSSKLQESGYEVVTASSGKAALDELNREKPGAVLLGVMIPELDGLQLLERIRKEDKHLPVFIITTFSSEERFRLARKLNASGFMIKSLDLDQELRRLLIDLA